MIYLLLSILSFSAIIISFRFFERFKVHTFQAIVINYITASAFGFILSGQPVTRFEILHATWLPNAFLIGLMFIFLFYMIALTAQKVGVSVSAVANKMSVVIPVVAAFYLYDDRLSALKITGIILALTGVFLSSIKDDIRKINWQFYLLPAILFVGSGLLDTYIKYTEEFILDEEDTVYFIPTAFTVAAMVGSAVVLLRFFVKPSRFSLSSIPAGLIVGLLNYASLFFLLRTLEVDDAESSIVFPLNNVGIVLVSTIASVIVFREKLSRLNWLGIICAAVAIILIAMMR